VDQSGEWQYNTLCVYDRYYAEGCANLEGELNQLGEWEYADPCALDEDEEGDDDEVQESSKVQENSN